MSFFAGSSRFTIANSHISEIGGDFLNINLITQEPAIDIIEQLSQKRKERDDNDSVLCGRSRKRQRFKSKNLDGLRVVNEDEIDMRKQLISGKSYRIHSASHAGSVVAVKVFEGPHAQEDWIVNVACAKKLLHSNIPRIIGISEESSESPFVVFRGMSEMRMDLLIAKALRTDLNESVQLSMKAVKGIAAGLSYMKSKKISLRAGRLMNNRKWENFDIFAGYDNEPVISIHVPHTVSERGSVSHSLECDGNGMEALNGLCEKLFSETNSILYHDSPERRFDVYDSEYISSISESRTMLPPSNSTKELTPRREVWWRLDMGSCDPSLDSITRCFEDYLACFLSPSSYSPLRRIRAPEDPHRKRIRHQCPGYLREEITLTPDVSRSAIISHEYPSQSELCLGCGQLIRYEESPTLAAIAVPPPVSSVPVKPVRLSTTNRKTKRPRYDFDSSIDPNAWSFSGSVPNEPLPPKRPRQWGSEIDVIRGRSPSPEAPRRFHDGHELTGSWVGPPFWISPSWPSPSRTTDYYSSSSFTGSSWSAGPSWPSPPRIEEPVNAFPSFNAKHLSGMPKDINETFGSWGKNADRFSLTNSSPPSDAYPNVKPEYLPEEALSKHVPYAGQKRAGKNRQSVRHRS